ncbi:MAG: sulfatase-like hydrolase/transferase [Thermoplasmata archaeon]|nr:sulfatase-like hydrolase/transferase [Thermoplasmata archaeon]
MTNPVPWSKEKEPLDVLVVVLDCVRAEDFAGGLTPVGGMPFVEQLQRESVAFPRATAPSPWTIPSHASLFTGLYPWQHGVHMKAALNLDTSLPTIPSLLHRQGYSTVSVSSNGFICPEFGLTAGFDASAWGDWWEKFLRLPESELPPRAVNFPRTQDLPTGSFWNSLESPVRYANRFPLLLNAGSHLASRILRPDAPFQPVVSPWIEPTVRGWVASQPAQTPLFCFVNLYDAHEPYLTEPSGLRGSRAIREYARLRMDRTSLLTGHWTPSPWEFDRLHELYRDMIRRMDVRIRALVDAFKDAGRWDRTLMILTSDHGQAFGEHGFLFHGYRVWEPLLRIPLWMRLPGGVAGGTQAKGWASLIDVAPTAMLAAGLSPEGFPSAVPLPDLIDRPRPEPVYSMADGVHVRKVLARMCPPERVDYWDTPFIAGYSDDRKMIFNISRETAELFDLVKDPREMNDTFAAHRGEVGPMFEGAREAGRQLLGKGGGSQSQSVEDRLRSWGYC